MPARKSARKSTTRSHSTPSTNVLIQLEATLESIFADRLPTLPKGLTNFIVSVGPWVILLSLVIAFPILLGALGLSVFLVPFSMLTKMGTNLTLDIFIAVAVTAINALALPGLFSRRLSGWRLLFYGSLVTFTGRLLAAEFTSLVFGALIGWYFLFQIKRYYK